MGKKSLAFFVFLIFSAAIGVLRFYPSGMTAPVFSPVAEPRDVEIEPEERKYTLIAVGDIMLGRKVDRLMLKFGQEYPLKEVKEKLKSADLTFGNLECAVSERGKPLPGKGIWLRARPETAAELSKSGFDVVSLANNHSLDYDSEALLDTVEYLRREGIACVGAGADIGEAKRPHIVDLEGLKVGFLAYTEMADMIWSYSYPRRLKATESDPGVAPFVYEEIVQDISDLSRQADIVIVSLHWGVEYSHMPVEAQREQARGMVDAGADIIIGHHPHVIQGVEVYKNSVIAYSLGNFVFDQNWSEDTCEGIAAEIEIVGKDVERVTLLPVIIRDSQPRFETSLRAANLAEKVRKYSLPLGTDARIIGDFKVEIDVGSKLAL